MLWIFSFLLLRLVFLLVSVVPLNFARMLGRFGAWVVYQFDRRGRRVAMQNLAHVFPLMSRAERRQLVRRNYSHLGICSAEFGRLNGISRDNLLALIVPEPGALETSRAAVAEGKGVIAVSSHIGSWELAVVAAREMGLETVAVAPPFSSPRIERLVKGIRERFGSKIIHRRGALWGLYPRLETGQSRGDHVGLLRWPHQPARAFLRPAGEYLRWRGLAAFKNRSPAAHGHDAAPSRPALRLARHAHRASGTHRNRRRKSARHHDARQPEL